MGISHPWAFLTSSPPHAFLLTWPIAVWFQKLDFAQISESGFLICPLCGLLSLGGTQACWGLEGGILNNLILTRNESMVM
jgi:hypothetical protein